ncbi:MAG TPA: hypothetical protein DDY18_07820 [Flavobacterium sp.]|mgnify:CR=1 FL=1|jgi:hypothetical protein|nr:hypothetical protein [Flavobacterium sp.]
MNILPSEVESIKVIGNLHGDDVKVVKTHGGFYVAVGKKKKSSSQAEALAAGSHQALVAHQLTKEYGADFEPAIFKSEQDQLEKVEARTEYLPSEMIAKGVELYILSKGNKIDFVLYKHGLTLGQYSSEIEDQTLVLKNGGFDYKEVVDKNVGTAKGIARALKEKVHELNLKGIKKGY